MIWKIFKNVLWLAAGAYAVAGLFIITSALGGSHVAVSLGRAYIVFGSVILIIGVTSAAVTFLANKWRGLVDPGATDSLFGASCCILRSVLDLPGKR